MSTGNFKQDVHAQLARVGKALSNGNRLELLEFVAQGPRSVDELATMTRLSVANASKHLQELRRADPAARILFLGTHRGLEARVIPAGGFAEPGLCIAAMQS